MSDLNIDTGGGNVLDCIEVVEAVVMRYGDEIDAMCWQRLRARLNSDREAVAIAICEAHTTPKGVLWWATDDETREKFRREADAAIAAMKGEP